MVMKSTTLVISFAGALLATTTYGQDPLTPLDFFNDGTSNSIGFFHNNGQVVTTNGQLEPDVQFVSTGILQLAQGAYSAHLKPRNSDRAFVARFIKQ